MTKIVGILNITPDSFSDGGKFNSLRNALTHLNQLLQEGADVIDVGAESTRPKATLISSEEEWLRLERILPEVVLAVRKFNDEFGKKVQISIDSYHFETIKKSHELGVEIINDVSGLKDERVIEFIAAKGIKTILMHSLSVPTDPELVVNSNLNVTKEILKWAQEKISYLLTKGVKKSQLIFDPGIGFGKDAKQSIRILKNIDMYRELGLPLYIGHSKKSFLDAIECGLKHGELTKSTKDPDQKVLDRAEKTLIISKYLVEKKVEFIRVHDVGETYSFVGNSSSN